MSDTPVQQQQIPVVTQVDPRKAHDVHLATTVEKLAQTLTGLAVAGKAPKALKVDVSSAPPPAPEAKEAPADGGGENIVDQASEANTAEAGTSNEETNTGVEESQVAPPAPKTVVEKAKESAAARLAKSLEIQKRAEAAKKKANEDSKRIEADRKEAAALRKQAEDDKKRIADIEADYQAKLRKLQTNPLEWAKENGISGADMAQFVKEGADPRAREIAMLRDDFSKALRAVKDEAESRYTGLVKAQQAAQLEGVQRQFLSFVDDAVKSAPDVYKALDVVYSKTELLAKADELAERNDRLQLGWTPDKLLEEIEIEAQADPRWARIQSRFSAVKPTTNTVTPKAQVQKKNPPQEETFVEESRTPTAPSRQRDDSGRFSHETPQSRHAAHLKRVLANVRF